MTGSGKLMREQTNKRHLLEVKSSRRKRRLSKDQPVAAADLRQFILEKPMAFGV